MATLHYCTPIHLNLSLFSYIVVHTVLSHVIGMCLITLRCGGGCNSWALLESLGSRMEEHAFLGLYDCLDLFTNFFFFLSFSQLSVSGDVGAFMTGHGQTSVMCLKLVSSPAELMVQLWGNTLVRHWKVLGFGLIKVEIKYLTNKVKLNYMVRDKSQPHGIGSLYTFHK